ncbi:MAG: 16S rRNA (guanine(527)-N(7))-methyltransferase RsmG [Lachnospiraceae bacterium]|jgi:16S rRNA (guanine527-N7)-methyltransferase|nr:16S rRNA (guanine(527)-N(7))-methyltransferase RsmG [Lachnospiraceae bacterium]
MSWTQSQLTKLKEDAFKFGIELNEKQLHQFIKYYELLVEWNSFMNLTAITEFEAVCTKHFIDSISLCKAVDCTKEYHVIDIGTGAGFPGIPLKIAFPNLKITLLDSLGKRVNFLNAVITELGLQEIEAIHGRAEDFAKTGVLRETFDICVSRAVANLSILSEYCLPYVKVGGYFISYKSEKVTEEIRMAQNAIQILGGEVSVKKVFLLPNSDIYRNLLMIKKVQNTPKKYPRKAGLPSKEPL